MKKGILVLLLVCVALALAGCACKHEETTLVGAKEATCTQEGYTGDVVCNKCNETVTAGAVVEMLPHDTELVDAREAYCSAEGYTGDEVCKACGEIIVPGQGIPMLPHTPGERRGQKDATCEKEGATGSISCDACYEILEPSEVIPALGHSLGEPAGVVEATCTQEGYSGDQTCGLCEKVFKGEVVERLAHDYVDNVCSVCGWMESGLYIDGERQMTWQQLLDGGYVRVHNKMEYCLQYISDALYGTLVIDESITKLGTADPLCPEGKSQLEYIYLPATTKVVEHHSFAKCVSLKEVFFFSTPAIHNAAFEGCVSLERFEIPEGLEVIPDYMLAGCTSLKSIVIPGHVKQVSMCAFQGCTALESVELQEGIEVIEHLVFTNTAIRELVLPSTVTSIGSLNDGGSMPNLTLIDMSKTSIVEQRGKLSGCPALKTVHFPQTLVSVYSYLFGNSYALEELVFPEGFTGLPDLFYIHEKEQNNVKSVVWPVSLLDGTALSNQCAELENIYYRGSEFQWSLTLSKDLFEGVEIVFNYEGEGTPE